MRRIGRILVICTGNVCRSPYIERRLRQLLDGADVQVESAGTGALVGSAIEPGSVDALGAVGADATGFASRQLTPALLDSADLVIAATQRHRADAVALHPRALRRTFTLGELADLVHGADLVEAAAETDTAPDAPWAAVVADIARGRRGLHPARPADESDIPDPYRQGAEAYAAMSTAIEAEIHTVATALTPPAS
ncbi:low molecular weight phosphatase family protein [Terrabacter sp. NPDC080008]|uniref:arsenate reductase/protein-tyrosine-phosphatase family protein n=1 Tax=Terrabacter sp. NPDC080008 TaxID=3155176 RepID=UPI003450D84A